MNFCRRFILALFPAALSIFPAFAQQRDSLHARKIIISNIKIEGNYITKSSIILRELTFKKGDTISSSDWAETMLRSKNNIKNTHLFNFANIDSVTNSGGGVDLEYIGGGRMVYMAAAGVSVGRTKFQCLVEPGPPEPE